MHTPGKPTAQDPILCVRTRLPEGGLDAFLEWPWNPIVNARNSHPGVEQENCVPFPLGWAAVAPNSKGFLATLGKPLAIAHELESEPGIWWLSTTNSRHDFIIFSDCHRKNAWKGGQLCIASRSGSLRYDSPGIQALLEGFCQVWGDPTKDSPYSAWACPEWFDKRAEELKGVGFPRLPPPEAAHPPTPRMRKR